MLAVLSIKTCVYTARYLHISQVGDIAEPCSCYVRFQLSNFIEQPFKDCKCKHTYSVDRGRSAWSSFSFAVIVAHSIGFKYILYVSYSWLFGANITIKHIVYFSQGCGSGSGRIRNVLPGSGSDQYEN